MSFRHILLSLGLIIFGVLPAMGQSNPGSSATTRSTYVISGDVRDDQTQQTLESIRVDLLRTSAAPPIDSVVTRGNGEFEFDGLANGVYFIEVELMDYENFQESILIDNASQRGVGIFLHASIKTATKNSNDTVSAHQLSVPSKAHDEFDKGMDLLYSKSNSRGAIDQFQRAIKDFPGYYEAYAQEGNAYFSLGDAAGGETALRKSIDLSAGRYADADFMLAGKLNDLKRYSEAESLAREGIMVDGSSWHGHLELAQALLGLKQPEEAEKSAMQARDLKPDNPSTYLILANVHIQRKDYIALLQDLDGYLKLAPTGPEADQARRTKEKLQATIEKAQAQPKPAQPQP